MTGRGWLQRQPLLGFLWLAFAWSWAFWWARGWLSPTVQLQAPWLAQLLMLAGGFGPSVAAVLVVRITRGRAGLRAWFARCLRWNRGRGALWGWMLLAFFAPLVVVLMAAGTHLALGGSIAPSPAVGQVPLALLNVLAVLLLGGPLGEEFGWRGYALPRLQAHMDWRPASVLLGAVWGVWHLPLFFISDTVQAHMTLALFLLSAVAMSVIFAWFAQHSGASVVTALVLHTAINYWPAIVPVLPTPQSVRPYALVVGIQVLLALGLMAWRGRVAAVSWGVRGQP